MISRELIKAEIDYVGDEYLDDLFNFIKAFRKPSDIDKNEWHDFIEKFSGCLSEHPIERGLSLNNKQPYTEDCREHLTDLSKYAGIITLNEEPADFQQRMRDEWD